VGTLTLLWASLLYGGVFHATAWGLRALLAAIGVGVTTHLLTLRTLTPEMLADNTPSEGRGSSDDA
jgi:hypothetical protein